MGRFVRLSAIGIATGALVVTGCLVGLSASAATPSHHLGAQHRGHGREPVVISALVAPSVPTDAAIFGVVAGGAPWTIQHGHALIERRGLLQVDVQGLVLTTIESNPVPYLAASVYCNGALAATTAPVPFSSEGDADIGALVSLPGLCVAPAILLNPALSASPSGVKTGIYIAFDGTASS